ncbi:proline dehydrogenase [Sphingopyxis lindanitolerans]|uniref:Proline dehydrogenase n=1 Tax=Sphingopyxis lindanitolerans TaxID=2054227 RepID=A0A2S8B851_9SPHN|nr:proline dehydrogenase [Sphingopyxis lindanitolerans]PQM28510.1 proline dehydrogenase [Sphingopyxis lindanitolerans]
MTSSSFWNWLRERRYALPHALGNMLPAPGPADAAALCDRLRRQGIAATVGYFQGDRDTPDTIVQSYRALLATGACSYLSVKAPPLDFNPGHLRAVADAATMAGTVLMLDSHGPADAEATIAASEALRADFPQTGCALPARWRRSLGDAARLRDTPTRLRIVKGEWADPDGDPDDIDAAYLALIERLAGRTAPVAVATHDPRLVGRALDRLVAAGTPCELEQLRGLPRRRTMAEARRRDVPIRIYIPFGPGWWPYAIDKALARPHLPLWWLRDRLGLPDRG